MRGGNSGPGPFQRQRAVRCGRRGPWVRDRPSPAPLYPYSILRVPLQLGGPPLDLDAPTLLHGTAARWQACLAQSSTLLLPGPAAVSLRTTKRRPLNCLVLAQWLVAQGQGIVQARHHGHARRSEPAGGRDPHDSEVLVSSVIV